MTSRSLQAVVHLEKWTPNNALVIIKSVSFTTRNDVVPVVMGAHPDDYRASAPPYSYIHVDDFESPQDLAQYLLKLNSTDALYNQYFRWKGTGRFIDTKFWCRLCTLVHLRRHQKYAHHYANPRAWWDGSGVCISQPSSGLWARWTKPNATRTTRLDGDGRSIRPTVS